MSVVTEQFDDLRFIGDVWVEMEQSYSQLSYENVLDNFAGVLEETHQSGFDARQSPSGEGWPPWAFRAFDAPDDHPTLEVSGRLRGSLRRDGSDHVETIGLREMTWGTSVPYSVIHQFGADMTLGIPLVQRGGGAYLRAGTRISIPKREHVGMSDATLERLAEDIADATVESLKPQI